MGYTTTFTGELQVWETEVNTNVSEVSIDVNKFCEQRHAYNTYPGIGTAWCDWEMVKDYEDGWVIRWNGREKSYDMEKWLQVINDIFLKPKGLFLEGEIVASGESPGDIWKIVANKDGIKTKKARIVYEDVE